MLGRIVPQVGLLRTVRPCCGLPPDKCVCAATRGLAGVVQNIFCPTGQGGGIDPTCGRHNTSGGTGGGGASKAAVAPRRSYDGVLRQVRTYMERPDPAKVAAAAKALAGLSREELRRLGRETGLVGGTSNKSKEVIVQKLATQIVRWVKNADRYAREARALGHGMEALRHYARQYRQVHNEHAGRINELINEARRRYQGANGKPLRRNNPAFNGDDYTKLKGWDSLARELAGNPKYSDLLYNAGYRGAGGKAAEKEAYQRLFDLVKAGPVPRMSYKEGYERALDHLRGMEPTRRRPVPPRRGKQPGQDDEPFDLF